jgi:hypothetical protein
MTAPTVNSPLSIIALFVALIELFLAYPVTRLEGAERLILVVFMTVFPFFVAAAFFFILWYRPIHLYRPQDITPALENRYQADVAEVARLKADNEDLQEENERLRRRSTPADAAVLSPESANRLAEEVRAMAPAEGARTSKAVPASPAPARADGWASVEEAKLAIQRTRREGKRQKERRIREEMTKFRAWLAGVGFNDLPPVPTIVIESAEVLNAYYDSTDGTAHLGADVTEDVDVIAHTYFHAVLSHLGVLTRFEGETAAIVEGLCDYFPCSYTGDPCLGKRFAAVLLARMGEAAARGAGLAGGCLRNLEQPVKVSQAGTEPHALGQVWSGGCWELRARYGAEQVDPALRLTIPKLGAKTSLRQAALVLQDELVKLVGAAAEPAVKEVFDKRGVAI